MDGLILVDTGMPTQRKTARKVAAVTGAREMTDAVNAVLAACGLRREQFSNRGNTAVLIELSRHFNGLSSGAGVVIAQAARVAAELDDMAVKVCARCGREFYVVKYLAAKPAYDVCRLEGCA